LPMRPETEDEVIETDIQKPESIWDRAI